MENSEKVASPRDIERPFKEDRRFLPNDGTGLIINDEIGIRIQNARNSRSLFIACDSSTQIIMSSEIDNPPEKKEREREREREREIIPGQITIFRKTFDSDKVCYLDPKFKLTFVGRRMQQGVEGVLLDLEATEPITIDKVDRLTDLRQTLTSRDLRRRLSGK